MTAKRRREPVSLGGLASDYLRGLDPGGAVHRGRAVLAWREVIPPEIERHTLGFAMRATELVVFVDTPAWATELAAMSEEVRVRLNEALGEELVASVRFTVSRHVRKHQDAVAAEAEEERRQEPESIEPIPLSEQELRQVAYVAADIEDDGLRETAIRVMTRDLELKKGRRAQGVAENGNRLSRGD